MSDNSTMFVYSIQIYSHDSVGVTLNVYKAIIRLTGSVVLFFVSKLKLKLNFFSDNNWASLVVVTLLIASALLFRLHKTFTIV